MLVKKGAFVRLRNHLLLPEERSKSLPESTTQVPYKSWTKGFLVEESELYENATVVTVTGRKVTGVLKEVEPRYKHTFGDYVPEIHRMRSVILEEVWGDGDV